MFVIKLGKAETSQHLSKREREAAIDLLLN
jgi:hypothetical protein